MICLAFSFSPFDKASPIDTNVLVVPLSALKTTILGSWSFVINCATWCMRSGFPTDVPPNFITFISAGIILFLDLRSEFTAFRRELKNDPPVISGHLQQHLVKGYH